MLLVCGKNSHTITPQMLSVSFSQLIDVVEKETDTSFLASLYRCFTDCVRVIGGPDALSPEFREGILNATRLQLQNMAEKRKARVSKRASLVAAASSSSSELDELTEQPAGVVAGSEGEGSESGLGGDDDLEDLQLLEELEDFALDDMSKMLRYFDPNQPLLIAIGSVKDLGVRARLGWDSSEEDDE